MEALQDRKAIGCKWVYTIKYKSNSEIEIYKAIFVAKGYSQEEGVDFDDTFSPVLKIVRITKTSNLLVKRFKG